MRSRPASYENLPEEVHETSCRHYQSLMYVVYAPPILYIRSPAV